MSLKEQEVIRMTPARIFIFFCMLHSALWIPSALIAEDQPSIKSDKIATYKIGVLAYKGKEAAIKEWAAHGALLSEKLAPLKFEIIPLGFGQNELTQAVIKQQIDFVITNPGYYIELELGGHVSRMATRRIAGPKGILDKFGGAAITRPDRTDLNNYVDLAGKEILIPSQSSLGGWQVHLREAMAQGIDLRLDSQIKELKDHHKVVEAIISGKADAGFVRSDLIEGMVNQGLLEFSQIKIINLKKETDYPYLLSTALYPEWPFARVSHTPTDIAVKVMHVLLALKPDNYAAKAAKIYGWTIPGHYNSVASLFRETGLGPYAKKKLTLKEVLNQYWQEIMFLTLIIVFILLFNTLKARHINKALYQEIEERKRVEKEQKTALEKIQTQDELIMTQSRHAAMGEMISMIAHQWRQPISVIAMEANNMLADIEFDEIEAESFAKDAKMIIKQTQHLSKTIDDFRNFFRPGKQKEYAKPRKIVDECLVIMGKSLENQNIELIKFYKSDRSLLIYSRELLQVIINILKNAKEALLENRKTDRKIIIRIFETKIYLQIDIIDNAGGITDKIQQSIFEPYFSTKDKKSGTGLGLYMSKIIIEEHMNGKLRIKNTSDGAQFSIILPIKVN